MKNKILFLCCVLCFNLTSQVVDSETKKDTLIHDSNGFVWNVFYESDSVSFVLFYGLDSLLLNNEKNKIKVNSLGAHFFNDLPLKKKIRFKTTNNENTLIEVSKNSSKYNKDVFCAFEKNYFMYDFEGEELDSILSVFINDYSYLFNVLNKECHFEEAFFMDDDEAISGYEFSEGDNIFTLGVKIKSKQFDEKTLTFSNVKYSLFLTVWIQNRKEWVIFKNK